MRTKFSGIFTLVLVFIVQMTFAQEKTVSGTVSDDNGVPLPGVDVVVKGENRGTQTDFDGMFTIEVTAQDVLQFKYMGFATQEVSVGNQTTLNVTLENDTELLDDVVVEAYRTVSKKTSNVASSTVTSKTIKGRPNVNFLQTLQGQVPGLNITTGSGQPGAGSNVLLRGLSSLNGSTEPLYVIDGMPQNSNVFRSLNPNEIENVSVLKDAAAAAIYGNRGANGVIVVTTRRGGFEQALEVNYIGTYGFNQLQRNDYNMLDSRGILGLENRFGNGFGTGLSQQEIDEFGINTNWRNQFFRRGATQDHTVTLSQGGKYLTSFTSIGFSKQDGILENSDLHRFSFRNNLNGKSADGKFEYGTNVTINYSQRNEMNSAGTGGVNQNYVLGANNSLPYVSPDQYVDSQTLVNDYNADGTLRLTPLFLMDKMRTFRDRTDEIKMIAGANAKYQIRDDLSIRTNMSFDYLQSNRNVFQSANSFNSFLFLEQGQEFGGFESNQHARQLLINNTTELRYQKTFNEDHTFQASLFTEYFKGHSRNMNFTQNGLNPISESGWGTGYIPYDPSNDFYVPEVSAGHIDAGLFSYFGFVDYDYKRKYGVSATVRRDAAFRFSDANRWGTFGSISARWNIDEEDFMENSIFDNLKLRGSWGVTGNQLIAGPSMFSGALLQFDTYGVRGGYAGAPGFGLTGLGNGDLSWERGYQSNIGVDFGLLENRVRGSMEVYSGETRGLYQDVLLSAINGITSLSANQGSMTNKGVELQVFYDLIRDRQNDFSITLGFNGSYNDNTIVSVPGDSNNTWDGSSLTGNFEGGIANQFYVLKYAGVNPTNGNLLFENADGELTENPDPGTDRYFTDQSFIPRIQGGFTLDADYKGFFLSTQFTFVADILRYDYDYSGVMNPNNIGVFNMSADVLNHWTPENRITTVPRLNANNRGLEEFSDRFLTDASYLRLRLLSFGYNLPQRWLGDNISGLRIFAQAENILTFSKWRGWDAESPRGGDQYQYPTPKIYNVGLELKF